MAMEKKVKSLKAAYDRAIAHLLSDDEIEAMLESLDEERSQRLEDDIVDKYDDEDDEDDEDEE